MAAQNQSLRTNVVKARIDKSQGDSLCRVCKLAHKEYKRRHDNLGKIVHWKINGMSISQKVL